MTDRELLEFSAKAAGIDLQMKPMFGGDAQSGYYEYPQESRPMWTWWNPLTDDGDALRLAVKLEIVPDKHDNTVVKSRSASWKAGAAHCSLWEPVGNDPYAATRRAIARAAAEIGKALS